MTITFLSLRKEVPGPNFFLIMVKLESFMIGYSKMEKSESSQTWIIPASHNFCQMFGSKTNSEIKRTIKSHVLMNDLQYCYEIIQILLFLRTIYFSLNCNICNIRNICTCHQEFIADLQSVATIHRIEGHSFCHSCSEHDIHWNANFERILFEK